MAQQEPLDFSQPKNDLGKIAEMERAKLFPRNIFNASNQYSAVNPDALATGDSNGKGTGGDLDVYNTEAGGVQDVLERKANTVVNEYQPKNPYTTPSA
jgi:hypothetical protein